MAFIWGGFVFPLLLLFTMTYQLFIFACLGQWPREAGQRQCVQASLVK